MFYNFMKHRWEDEGAEHVRGAWYIKCGFCGYNGPVNNRQGYKTKDAAETTIKRYQGKSDYIKSLTPA